MIKRPFNHHRQAALSMLNECLTLSHKEAGFLGNVCVAPILSNRQLDWLSKLLERNGLPPFSVGDAL
jgi:hypothetical protein